MNNILDLSKEANQRFIASVLCVLCESSPLTLSLQDIKKYFAGEILLQYDMVADQNADGSITFSLRKE